MGIRFVNLMMLLAVIAHMLFYVGLIVIAGLVIKYIVL